MILAAGFGTRLLPHPLVRPKPLFPVLNHPLLLLLVARLRRFGFERIVINCHHLADQVVASLAGLPGVTVQQEENILGTGGGLARAVAGLDREPLLVCNGDIYHTIDLQALYRHHCRSGNLVTMALHDFPRFNSVLVAGGRLTGFAGRPVPGGLAFTGLQVIDPRVVATLSADHPSCIIDRYRQMLAAGEPIGCLRVDGCFWSDMGTAEDYLALHQGLLTGMAPMWQEFGKIPRPLCIAADARLGRECRLSDWVSLGAARIGHRCHLERVVIWEGVDIPDGSCLVDRIVSSQASLVEEGGQ
jgi:mannose-1-phosphate guanylyltransferase